MELEGYLGDDSCGWVTDDEGHKSGRSAGRVDLQWIFALVLQMKKVKVLVKFVVNMSVKLVVKLVVKKCVKKGVKK